MKLPASLLSRLKAKSPEWFVTYLATSSKDGRTNLIPIAFSDVINDELVVLPDLFAQKTKVNLNENHHAALSFAAADGLFHLVLEGAADIVQWGHPASFTLFGLKAGDVLARYGDWDETVEPVVTADEAIRPAVFAERGVIVFRPERIVEASV